MMPSFANPDFRNHSHCMVRITRDSRMSQSLHVDAQSLHGQSQSLHVESQSLHVPLRNLKEQQRNFKWFLEKKVLLSPLRGEQHASRAVDSFLFVRAR
jgi:hypothetical protein